MLSRWRFFEDSLIFLIYIKIRLRVDRQAQGRRNERVLGVRADWVSFYFQQTIATVINFLKVHFISFIFVSDFWKPLITVLIHPINNRFMCQVSRDVVFQRRSKLAKTWTRPMPFALLLWPRALRRSLRVARVIWEMRFAVPRAHTWVGRPLSRAPKIRWFYIKTRRYEARSLKLFVNFCLKQLIVYSLISLEVALFNFHYF